MRWYGTTARFAPAAATGLLYLLQLLAHAVTLGCIYGLLAIGYTLVYAIIGRINLAFGEIAPVEKLFENAAQLAHRPLPPARRPLRSARKLPSSAGPSGVRMLSG